jgi:hypothetical protein
MTNAFTHLGVHSHYSLLGATASPADLAHQAAADSLTHLALTARNGLYGAAFDRACRAAGVQPLSGMTVNVAAPARETVAHPEIPGRLVLLATGLAGYRSLCRLTADLLARGDTVAVFQCESAGAQRTLRQLRAGDDCPVVGGTAVYQLERSAAAGAAARQRADPSHPCGALAGLGVSRAALLAEVGRGLVGVELRAFVSELLKRPQAAMWWKGPRGGVKRVAAVSVNCK